jgi:antitoxin FitA
LNVAQILVRDLDDALVARLKERAKLNHRSLQGEVKAILEETAAQATEAEVEAILEKWRKHWGDRQFSDSAELIRELRER